MGWESWGSLLESCLEHEIVLSFQCPGMLREPASLLFSWYGWNVGRAAPRDLRALRRSVVLLLRA